MKTLIPVAAVTLLAAAPTEASAQPAVPAAGPPWIVTPAEASCRVQLDLVGRSGAVTPVTLASDGEILSLRFSKPGLPERAFLPVRVDGARYSNLMLRGPDGDAGELILSEETEAALRRGSSLDVAWLADEPLGVSLAGSGQGLTDLRICGAQIAAQARASAQAQTEAKMRAEQEAREQAVAQAQLEAARAQAAAADAQRQRIAEEAERQRRLEADERQRQYAEAQRRRYEEDRRRAWEEEQDAYYRPAPAYPPPYRYRGW